MTREQAAEHQRKHGFAIAPLSGPGKRGEEQCDPRHESNLRMVQRMTVPEIEMGLILEAQKRAGEILRYEYEGIRLAWGRDPNTGKPMWYKPDFVVIVNLGKEGMFVGRPSISVSPVIEGRCIEVKGPRIWDRDIVRFKGARAAWPEFQFEMHQRDKEGRWHRLH